MSDSHRPFPQWIAHRGGGALAPENTLAAMRMGARMGFRAVEFDVKLSADGVCFLLHDDTLERTTDGHGAAAGQDWAALSRLDAGGWFGPSCAGEPIALLADVARYCQANGVAANVEIKPCPGRERETGRAVAQASAQLWQGGAAAPLLSSFSWDALVAARAQAPKLPLGWLVEHWPADWSQRLAELSCVALHCDHLLLDQGRVRAVREAGYRLLCYTVNDPRRARQLLDWGVDGLITDALAQRPAEGETPSWI
jgi:glycerophosphoryl diester phosphodiesterase